MNYKIGRLFITADILRYKVVIFFNEVKTKILWGEGCYLDQFLERKSALQAVRLVSAFFKRVTRFLHAKTFYIFWSQR